MHRLSSEKIINSLAEITRHTDRELLETSLATALYDLLEIPSVTLYKVLYDGKKVEYACSLKVENGKTTVLNVVTSKEKIDSHIISALDRCLTTKKTVNIKPLGMGNIAFYPIFNQFDKVISVYRIDWSDAGEKINKGTISGYFQVYKNYIKLLDQSERDTLTGLLNRRTFDRDLMKILSEKNKQNTVLQENEQRCHEGRSDSHWLAVSDVDFFKRVNDNFGHVYGDEVLLLLSNIMRESFRSSDIIFRFGGEEFVIILPSTSKEGVYNALERFRKTVENYPFPQVGQVTISIGYVEITANSIPAAILGHADEALYFSKDNGRNQLNQYEKLVEEGKIVNREDAVDDIELF